MPMSDIGVCAPFLLALFYWSRGLWRRQRGDIFLGAAIFAVAIVLYTHLYSYMSLSGIPWICAIGAGVIAAAIAAFRRSAGPVRPSAIAGVLAPLCLAAALFVAERKWSAPSNSLMVIAPYRHAGTWVFDDPRVGLRAEPFVAGIPELIDRLVADARIENPDLGFRLVFSLAPFPGHQARVVWRRAEAGGNWYYCEKYNAEGWLCPALFKYYRRAPKEIYVKAEAK